jgi:hypothetical protein
MAEFVHANLVRVSTFIECIKAAHLSSYVQSAFSHACGLFVVGAPGTIKTTLLECLDHYESALPLSDVNNRTLQKLKGHLTANAIRTLVIPEMQKLYERDPRTAIGVEGTLRALVEEGYRGASFDEPTALRFRARAVVIGAMPETFRDQHWDRWTESGFARRFLWCLVRLGDPAILMEAVERGVMAQYDDEPVTMNTPIALSTPNGMIPAIGAELRKRIRPLVAKQPRPANVQFELMCRMCAVLKFYYERVKSKKDPLATLREFSACIKGGADLVGLSFNGDYGTKEYK